MCTIEGPIRPNRQLQVNFASRGIDSNGQAVMLPGLQALRVARLNAAAGAGALLVNPACHVLPDLTLQHHAPDRLGLGAAHAAVQVPDRLGQRYGNGTAWRIVRLSPVKGHAKHGAARATLLTVELHAHALPHHLAPPRMRHACQASAGAHPNPDGPPEDQLGLGSWSIRFSGTTRRYVA